MSVRRALIVALAVAAGLAGRADAAITYVNASSVASTTATLTITKPTNTTTNDVLVATVSGAGTNTITAPSGWTLLASTASPGNTMRTLTYYKVATSSEGTSYAFTSSAARNMTGGIIALRGANPAHPIDAVGTATGASGSAVAPSVTTTSANDWVITSASAARNTTFTPASGTTERYDRAGTSTSNNAATAAQSTAGATPARTVVPANNTANWGAHTIAVRDAAAAGLSVSMSGSPSFSANLNSGDTTATFSVPAFVLDTRTTNPGWQLTVTSTHFTTGTRTLPATATEITSVSGAACDSANPCVLPTNTVALPVGVPAGATAPTAVKFFNAAANTGEGGIDMSVGFSVEVPQSAYAGTYSSTVTVSVVSGP